MIRGAALLIALAFAVAFLEQLAARGPLRLQVRPAFAFFGSDIEIRLHVQNADEGELRFLETIVEAEHFFTASTREVHPNDPAQLPSLWIIRPPPGHYHVASTLYDRTGKLLARERAEAEILDGVPRER